MDKSASHEGQFIFLSYLGIVLHTLIHCAVMGCTALSIHFKYQLESLNSRAFHMHLVCGLWVMMEVGR